MFQSAAHALTIIVLLGGQSLEAQSRTSWAPEVVAPGDRVNLYADWPGEQPADALSIDIPADWEVISAEAVRLGRNDRVPLELRRSVDGVLAESATPLFGLQRFILTLRAPQPEGGSSISMVPVTRNHDGETVRTESHSRYEFEYDIRVERPRPTSKQALRLNRRRNPISVEPRHIPDFERATGLTVAFWLKSVDRDKIVVSSWNGEGHRDYPFEFVVAAGGEIRVFTGKAGMHYSLGSSVPVADGDWHHLAFSANFSTGEAIITIDGARSDTRFLPNIANIRAERLVFGGRTAAGRDGLDGSIDEVVILSSPRTADEIARMARIPAASMQSETGSLIIDFDTGRSLSILNGAEPDRDLGPSHVTLHEPVHDVVAEFLPGRVLLSWTVERPEAQKIVVERSVDGLRFEPIHQVIIDQIELERMADREPFSFEDFLSEGAPIHFYRVTQEFADGAILQSQMIKVGIGALELPTDVELLGNSPNPFSDMTEVAFRVESPTSLRLSVWSVSGHMVELLASETREVGLHRIPFEAGDLPSGTYFLRLETEAGVQTTKMIVRR